MAEQTGVPRPPQEETTQKSATIAEPRSLAETGVPPSLLEALALKILYLRGEATLVDLAEQTRLSFAVVEEIFQHLRKECLCEVKGMVGHVYRIALTSEGRSRAHELMSLSQYAGPAPVSLSDYTARVRAQSVTTAEVRPSDLFRPYEHLVLDDRMRARLGIALASGMSILLYGPPGTGKTSIAEGLAGVYNDEVWIPYAVEIGGQVISVYDSAIHRRVGEPSLGNKPNWGLYKHSTDARWVLCRRPRVIVGGELTIEMLDVQPDVINKCYSAPLQMKANNGVFVVDDFGRQLVPTDVLFNRWMVPLDRRVDFLSLAGGKKSEIPFDLFVVFVTNLHPAELGGAAFFRRIPNKIRVDYPTPGQFHEICRKVCQEFHLQYDMDAAEYLIQLLTVEFQRPLRACYPRDIVRQICWKARWEAKQPRFDRSTVSEACCDCFGFDVDCWTPGTEFEPSQPMLGTKPEQRARARTPVYS